MQTMLSSGGSTERHAKRVNPSLQPVFRAGPGMEGSQLPGTVIAGFMPVVQEADRRLDVRALIAAQQWKGPNPLVVVVAEDLASPGCASIFGYADPAAGVAVVSTFRLGKGGCDLLDARLCKVIAHEWMHLRGRRHCRQPECLMHPVQSPEELDARGSALCPRCRTAHPWRGTAVAAAIALALSGALDLTVSALQTKSRPFSARTGNGIAQVFYQETGILQLPAADSHQCGQLARQLASRLNALFAEIDPPPLQVTVSEDTATVSAGDLLLLTVTPAMAGEQDAEMVAQHFAAQVQPLLEGKGRPGESCPMCHIGRREQVREAVARPPRFWR